MHPHVPRCDCAECVPGFPAAQTSVRIDATSLHEPEPEPEPVTKDRRLEQIRRANRKWREKNIERAREATRQWRQNNPENVKLSKLLSRKFEREERQRERERELELERQNEEGTAAE